MTQRGQFRMAFDTLCLTGSEAEILFTPFKPPWSRAAFLAALAASSAAISARVLRLRLCSAWGRDRALIW
jgi:hypothetical protein